MTSTLADHLEQIEPTNVRPEKPPAVAVSVKQARPPETDILLWLSSNSPRTVEELNAVRYVLYHRCSRADFKVSKRHDEAFVLFGRQSAVFIVSNRARRYLWRLRNLAREEGWVRGNTIKRITD